MISRRRWTKVEPTLDRALELGPEEASLYLDRACGEDAALRNEVWRLYRACRAAEDRLSILDTPAGELARPLVEEAPAPQAELRPGEAVGPYRIERPLGRGGMGIVYLAHDPRLDRPVALKFLPPWLAANDLARRRFAREAKAASALDHPNVQTVYEIAETEDARPYIALAYYEGETLEERLRRGPLPVEQSVELASQLAEGLGAAHARGIVHRDLKPGNVIVTPEGVAKILDFGIAEVAGRSPAKASRAAGTLAYMSPEQIGGREVDGRSDLWSLGVVLYEMLAGRRPFPPPRAPPLRDAGASREAPEPLEEARDGLPDPLDAVVRRCLEEAPEDRYPDADALLADLVPLRGERAVPAAGDSEGVGWIRRFGLRSRRLAVLATAGVAALAGAGYLTLQGDNADLKPGLSPEHEQPVAAGTGAARAAIELTREAERLRGVAGMGSRRRRLYRRALELDPTHAEAWAGLASAYAAWGGSRLRADSQRLLAERALALDPELSDAYTQLGDAFWVLGDEDGQLDAYRKALELEPGNREAAGNLSTYLQLEGRLADKMKWLEWLHRASPRSFVGSLALLNAQLGRHSVAAAWLDYAQDHGRSLFLTRFQLSLLLHGDIQRARELLEIGSPPTGDASVTRWRAALALYEGDWAQARGHYRTLYTTPGASNPIFKGLLADRIGLAWALGRLGQRQEAREIADEVARAAELEIESGTVDNALPRHRLAVAHLIRGDTARALDWLEAAAEVGYRSVETLKHVPTLAPLRDHPRFRALLERMEALVAEERRRVEAEGWGVPG